MLKVSKISIFNGLGLDEYVLEPGPRITLVKAANAGGKSSVVQSIKAALGGPKVIADATLIRAGMDRSEVLIAFSNGGKPHGELKATIRPDKIDRKVNLPGIGNIGAPATWLSDLLHLPSINPVDFLSITDAKERARWLLEAVPLELSEQDLTSDTGFTKPEIAELLRLHPLEALRRSENKLIEMRREHSRLAKERRSAVNTLAETAPKLEVVAPTRDVLQERVDHAGELVTQKSDELRAIDEAMNFEQRAISEEYAAALNKAAAEQARRLTALSAKKAELEKEVSAKFDPEIFKAGEAVEACRRSLESAAKIEQSKAAQKKFREEAEHAEAAAKKVDDCVEAVKARRVELMKQNPLPGCEIVDNQILIKGVAFERVNEGERIDLAVRLAEESAGKLGFICIDGIDRLDPEHQERLVARLLESKMQCIMTEIALGPLRSVEINSVEDLRGSQRENAQLILERTES